MNFTDETLQILARQLGGDTAFSRVDLEASLARLLSLVLRTGRGHPVLVQWVQLNLPEVDPGARFGPTIDASRVAPPLARLLCSQLFRKVRARRDTVGERQTVLAH
jgi:hypothetical protein